ncbi:MAG TPA: 5'-methylthioadenosine/adenosylhomocysteine nucleosidase [Bacillales bacterium]|nr:5'-methylthioadenosine/adenosylhomocysteine nucleosidase [Bacillales bacterium]
MTIGIIGAMDEEIEGLKTAIGDYTEQTAGGCLFIKGELQGKPVVVVKSGIGKVNAAIATTMLIQKFEPQLLINTGSAGGFHEELKVGDIVISTEVRYHDVDATIFGYEYGQVPGMTASFTADRELIETAVTAAQKIPNVRVEKGLIVSGDSFMNDQARVDFVNSKFKRLLAAEMEAAAIAHTCSRFDVPFVVIRSLSDIAGKESNVSFEQFLPTAARHSNAVIQNMLKELKVHA